MAYDVDTSRFAWVYFVGRVQLGRTDALDGGWYHNGRLRKFGFIPISVVPAWGLGFVFGKRFYVLYIIK